MLEYEGGKVRRLRSFAQASRSHPIISFFEEDPETPAHKARLFWDATIDPAVLRATATQAEPCAAGRFDLFDLPVSATVLLLPDREELLLGQAAGRSASV